MKEKSNGPESTRKTDQFGCFQDQQINVTKNSCFLRNKHSNVSIVTLTLLNNQKHVRSALMAASTKNIEQALAEIFQKKQKHFFDMLPASFVCMLFTTKNKNNVQKLVTLEEGREEKIVMNVVFFSFKDKIVVHRYTIRRCCR